MEGTVTVLNWLGFLGNVIAQCHVYLMILCNSFSNLILFTICEHYIIQIQYYIGTCAICIECY